MNDIEIALHAMEKEKNAIEAMMQLHDDTLPAIIQQLYDCKGRIIFCGVGKSGLIGKKLAATFASTGSPAMFLHATEALHGDLGMVQKEDIVILLSNSGATQEVLAAMIALKQLQLTCIAMSAKRDSQLVKECDAALLIPELEEADYLHVAPTVSSTCMLVLGDAIACVLMEKKEFQKKQFHAFHPGGSLGKKLENVV